MTKRLQLTQEFIKENDLICTPPPENSLFFIMWNHAKNIAEQVLHTDFIQSIKRGSLHPDRYAGFNVNDAYYCHFGPSDYLAAAGRAGTLPVLRNLLMQKSNSYKVYNESIQKILHINMEDVSSIIPTPNNKSYAEYESEVCRDEKKYPSAAYALIVMLPCEYLWYWIANQIISSMKPDNLYYFWAKENNDPTSSYAIGNFLEQHRHSLNIDEGIAIQIYQTAMMYELKNFQESLNN